MAQDTEKLNRIIKLTEAQLMEVEGMSFEYLNGDSEAKPFDAQTEISVNCPPGIADRLGIDVEPSDTDDIASKVPSQGRSMWRARSMGRTIFHEQDQTKANNAAPDDPKKDNYGENVANTTGMGVIRDKNSTNDVTVLPQSVLDKIQLLINVCQTEELNAKKCEMVIIKLLQNLNFQNLPYSLTKDMMVTFKAAQNNGKV